MTTGLVRVTVAAPTRRIDVALPERAPVGEVLPGLLRHAGETLADDGVLDGGWLLRRADGSSLDAGRSLGAYRVRDGEVLHLVTRRTEWPELEYDDVVDAIAAGAGRTGRLWSPAHTRFAGLALAAACVLFPLVALLVAGPPWSRLGWGALGVAALLLVGGAVVARAVGDAEAGAVIGALALPHAFAGAAAMWGDSLPLSAFGAPHLLAGSAAVVVIGALALVGVVHGAPVFTAAVTCGLLGVLGAWLATTEALDGVESAAIVAAAVLVCSPLFAPLSIRMSRVPMPVLPRTPADLVRDDPQPPRHAVYAAVLRADALLTGMLWGACLVAAVCQVLLARDGGVSAIVLLVVLCLGFCVRARLYPAIRHRLPVLAAGCVGVVCALALLPVWASPAFAVLFVLCGLIFGRRAPNAFLGRYAEVLEVVLVLACVPVVCAVLGLYGLVRGLGG